MAPSPRDRSAPNFKAVVRVLLASFVSYTNPLMSPKTRGEMKMIQCALRAEMEMTTSTEGKGHAACEGPEAYEIGHVNGHSDRQASDK